MAITVSAFAEVLNTKLLAPFRRAVLPLALAAAKP